MTTENYVKAVQEIAEKLGISAYQFTLGAIGSHQQPSRIKSAEIRFNDDSLEAMKKNMEILAEHGAKMVDYSPIVDGFIVYGSPECLSALKKSDAIATLDLNEREHGPTKMFKK